MVALIENPFNLRAMGGGIMIDKETGEAKTDQAPTLAIVDADHPFTAPNATLNPSPQRGLIAVIDTANNVIHLNEMYATASECYYFHGLAKCFDLELEGWDNDIPFWVST